VISPEPDWAGIFRGWLNGLDVEDFLDAADGLDPDALDFYRSGKRPPRSVVDVAVRLSRPSNDFGAV
jgi:hypothetical protein